MPANDEFLSILEEVDLLVAEMRELQESGPHFRIYHRFHKPGTVCAPGEEIAAVCLVHHGREYPLRLSLALRILFDYLARHSRLPQSASQIEAGVCADHFSARHAATVMGARTFTRSIARSCIKVYIERLRSALGDTSQEVGLQLDPRKVLLNQETKGNEVGYRLKASIEWTHIPI